MPLHDISGAAGGGFLFDAYIYLRDEKAANTVGGAATTGSWQTRTLNTEVTDTDGLCSLASNQFTLTAGTYWLWGSARFYQTNRTKLRIRNTTDSTTLIVGDSAYLNENNAGGFASVRGSFTVAASKALELQYQVENSSAGNTRALGVESNFGEVEVYSVIELFRMP